MKQSLDLYDEITYTGRPSPERMLDRLWWMGRLRGVASAQPSDANVLEIGCSTGRQLISIAERFPRSKCLGIDSSSQQIKEAKDFATKASVANIEFVASDILDYKIEPQTYDYLICHGVYSWVPDSAAKKMLSVIKKALRPTGIAYLSHNSLPGWQARHHVCQILASFDDETQSATERIAKARTVLSDGIARLIDTFRPYGMQLKEEFERNLNRSDAFILHELLNPDVSAIPLSAIIEQGNSEGLFYLGDAHPQRNQHCDLRYEPLGKEIEQHDVSYHQYLDYLFPTSFRGSLFTTKEISVSDPPQVEMIQETWISSPLVPDTTYTTTEQLYDYTMVPFYGPSEEVVELKAPVVKALLSILSEIWPRPVRYTELLSALTQKISLADGEERKLQEQLLQLFFRNLLDVFSADLCAEKKLGAYPRLSKAARVGISSGWITTLRGEFYKIDPLDQVLLPSLDGMTNTNELLDVVKKALKTGALRAEGEGISEENNEEEALSEAIEEKLGTYVEQALLVDASNKEREPFSIDWNSLEKRFSTNDDE